MINWDATDDEATAIAEIAQRAARMGLGHIKELVDIEMDITACHLNGCPLDLARLAGLDDANFGHDVGGIRRFLDRHTGELTECFVPRCALVAARA